MPLINSLESGVTALKSFTKGIDVIGNNIANVNTVGYKASRVDYSETFSNTLQRSVAGSGDQGNTVTMQVGSGVKLGDIRSRFTQGTLSDTSVPTDFAISGEGFFVVKDAANQADYATRAGNFREDNSGYLVTSQGFRLQGMGGGMPTYEVTVDSSGNPVFTRTGSTAPATQGDIAVNVEISVGNGIINNTGGTFTDAELNNHVEKPGVTGFEVSHDGNIIINTSDGKSFQSGTVLLTNFTDPQALVHSGNGLFTNWEAAGVLNGGNLDVSNNTPSLTGLGSIGSGKLELSNVELTEEFANIITMQRSFQAGARIVTTSDSILEEVVNLKR